MSKYEPNAMEVVDVCTRRLTALREYVPNAATEIYVEGDNLTASGVAAVYQGCLDAHAHVSALRAQLHAALAARAAVDDRRVVTDRALKAWVTQRFGSASHEAHDFGFPPAKKPVLTMEDKARAVALNRATREARHTMGARQREKIHGSLAPSPLESASTAAGQAPGARQE